MDLDFFRRRKGGLATTAIAALDYELLVAALAAMQASTPAARAELGAAASDPALAPSQHPLAELLLGGSGWREAIQAQAGRFNRAQAARFGNGMSTQMTGAFTFAFQPSFNGAGLSAVEQRQDCSRSNGDF